MQNFSIVLHVACVTGLVVSIFGVPYSPLAVFIYGGHLLYDNGGTPIAYVLLLRRVEFKVYVSGGTLLSLYCVYLSVLAVNGITECFAMATMSNVQVGRDRLTLRES